MVKYKFYLQLDDGKKGNYENFLDELAKKESQGSHDYHAIGYANYFGRYQIGEDTIHDTGYYTNYKITKYSKNGSSAFKWDGKWERPKHLSIKSLNEFVAYKDSCPKDNGGIINPFVKKGNSFVYDTTQFDKEKLPKAKLVQEDVIRIVHQKKWWAVWELFTTPAERTQFNNIKSDSERKNIMIEKLKIGKSFSYEGKNYTITTSGLIAGAHLVGQGAVRKFIVDGEIYKDGNGTPITKYIGELGGFNMTNLFSYERINERQSYEPIKDGNNTSTISVNTANTTGSTTTSTDKSKSSTTNTTTANSSSTTTTSTTKKPVAEKKVEKSASGEITIKDYKKGQYKLNVPDYLDENGKPIPIDNTGAITEKTIAAIDTTAKVVVNGAILKCNKGNTTSTLKITSEKKITINANTIAVITETVPIKNIESFGMCSSTANPEVQNIIAQTKGATKEYACTPKSIGKWTNGVPFFMGEEKVVSDKSTCNCTWGGEISIEKSQEGQKFFTYGTIGGGDTQKKEEKKEEEKKEEKKKEAEKTSTQVNNAVSSTVNVVTNNTNGQYLLEIEGESKEKIVQRHLKAIGFNLNHKDCKECDAYGAKAESNNYKCSKNYKCIDGDIGVKSASALIIFQSKCNPANSGAQKTGEPNIITGLADDITIKSLGNYSEIKKKEGKEKRGIVKLKREDLIKDWKPEKYETIGNGHMPSDLIVHIPNQKGGTKATNLPSTSVAWAMMIQGCIDYNKITKKPLALSYFSIQDWDCGFRSYEQQLYYFIKYNCDGGKAARPVFKDKQNEMEKYIKDNNSYCLLNYKILAKDKLSGTGISNHGIGRAFDFKAGSGEHYLADDTDGTTELLWLNDNAGRYGFSGYVKAFKNEKINLLKTDWYNKSKQGFKHKETWHWEYLVDNKTYKSKSGMEYRRTDCFIKEIRDKLLK